MKVVFVTVALLSGLPADGAEPSRIATMLAELGGPDSARRRTALDQLDFQLTVELGAASVAAAKPYLLRALADPDPQVRSRALGVIGHHRIEGCTAPIVGLLGDAEPSVRARAVTALAESEAGVDPLAHTQQTLRRALSDTESEVREAALVALARAVDDLDRATHEAIIGRLEDERVSVRRTAAEALGHLRERQALVPLIGRLNDPSREVRAAALAALVGIGDLRAAAAMVHLLGDSSEEVRADAASALGQLGARAAVPALIDLLERSSDGLSGRAAISLAQIARTHPVADDPALAAVVAGLLRPDRLAAAREALLAVLSDRPDSTTASADLAAVRSTPSTIDRPSVLRAVSSLLIDRLSSPEASCSDASDVELQAGGCATRWVLLALLGRSRDARATDLIELELSRPGRPIELLVDALGNLVRGGDRRSVATLVALLASPRPSIRRHAATALSGVADGRASTALMEAAVDSDLEVRRLAIAELGRLRVQRSLPILLRALETGDELTAVAAARALGNLGDRRATSKLIETLDRKPDRVRMAATTTLEQLQDDRMQNALVQTAAKSPDALATLASVARGHAQPATRQLLLALSLGKDPARATSAVDGLAAAGDLTVVPQLLGLLQDAKSAPLRRRVAQALGELSSANPASAPRTKSDAHAGLKVVDRLCQALTSDPDGQVRAEAAWALGRLPPSEKSLAALAEELRSPSAPIRTNAAAALARLRSSSSALYRLLSDPNPAVRSNAALALGRAPAAQRALQRLASSDPDPHTRAAARLAVDDHAPLRAEPSSAANRNGPDWLAILVTDHEGRAIDAAAALLRLPDGLTKAVLSDARGMVREEWVSSGTYQIDLLDHPGAQP